MKIVERSPGRLKLVEPLPPALKRSFLFAGVFLSLPMVGAIAIFRTGTAVLFALANVAGIAVLVTAVYFLALHVFRSKATATFDRAAGTLTAEWTNHPTEVVPLREIAGVEVEKTWTGRTYSYRTVLLLDGGARFALSESFRPGKDAFEESEIAVREFLSRK